MVSEHNDSTEQATPLSECTAFQRDILAVLSQLPEKPKGLRIKGELERNYHAEIGPGRLYHNLDELADEGLIEKGDLDARTNYYRLTPRGQRELAADHQWRN